MAVGATRFGRRVASRGVYRLYEAEWAWARKKDEYVHVGRLVLLAANALVIGLVAVLLMTVFNQKSGNPTSVAASARLARAPQALTRQSHRSLPGPIHRVAVARAVRHATPAPAAPISSPAPSVATSADSTPPASSVTSPTSSPASTPAENTPAESTPVENAPVENAPVASARPVSTPTSSSGTGERQAASRGRTGSGSDGSSSGSGSGVVSGGG
jgi:uncharacterized membrane protein YgcG